MLQFCDVPLFPFQGGPVRAQIFPPDRGREAIPGKIMQPNRAKKEREEKWRQFPESPENNAVFSSASGFGDESREKMPPWSLRLIRKSRMHILTRLTFPRHTTVTFPVESCRRWRRFPLTARGQTELPNFTVKPLGGSQCPLAKFSPRPFSASQSPARPWPASWSSTVPPPFFLSCRKPVKPSWLPIPIFSFPFPAAVPAMASRPSWKASATLP